MRDRSRPVEALQAVFARIGHPLLFESLLDLMAELWDIRDAVVESGGEYPADARGAINSTRSKAVNISRAVA